MLMFMFMFRALLVFLIFSIVNVSLAQPLNSYADAYNAMKKHNAPGVIIFSASWCKPCQKMKKETWEPLMKQLQKNYIVYFVDVDAEPEIVASLKKRNPHILMLKGIPAYFITTKGATKIVAYGEGYKTQEQLRSWANTGINKFYGKKTAPTQPPAQPPVYRGRRGNC